MTGLLSDERELLARMIQAEAGNQGELGMLAVGAVMDNRRRAPGYGGSDFRSVLLAPGQFSPANSITGYAGGEQGVDLTRLRPSETAYRVADMVLAGNYEDPTGGALNFLNPDISQPAWLSSMTNTRRIGDHLFGTAGNKEGVRGRPGGNVAGGAGDNRAVGGLSVTPVQGGDPSQARQPDTLQEGPAVDYQAPRGLLSVMFPNMDPQMQDTIRMGMAGLGQVPNRAVQGAVMDRRAQFRDQRERAAEVQRANMERNRTVEAVRQYVRGFGAPAELERLATVDPNLAMQELQRWRQSQQVAAPQADWKWNEDLGQFVDMNDPARMMAPPEGMAGADGDMTESERRIFMFNNIQQQTGPVINRIEEQGFNPSNPRDYFANGTLGGNWAQSTEGQMYNAAASSWAESALRLATGAAATPEEHERIMNMYFAMPGDSRETIRFKRAMRDAYQGVLSSTLEGDRNAEIPNPLMFAIDEFYGGRGRSPQPADSTQQAPRLGEVVDGHEYIGGPPGDRSSWRPVGDTRGSRRDRQ